MRLSIDQKDLFLVFVFSFIAFLVCFSLDLVLCSVSFLLTVFVLQTCLVVFIYCLTVFGITCFSFVTHSSLFLLQTMIPLLVCRPLFSLFVIQTFFKDQLCLQTTKLPHKTLYCSVALLSCTNVGQGRILSQPPLYQPQVFEARPDTCKKTSSYALNAACYGFTIVSSPLLVPAPTALICGTAAYVLFKCSSVRSKTSSYAKFGSKTGGPQG